MRFDHDLLGGGNGFLVLLLVQVSGRRARFLDHSCGLVIRAGHHLLALSLGPIELGFDFLGVSDAQGDLLAPLVQHREDAPIGELIEHKAHDAEADDLRP